jgi:hypothetical protein
MAFPVSSRSTNDLITASIWNADIVDNINYLYNGRPSCRVYHNTTQALTSGADNVVVFNSERWDTDTMHSTVSNTGRITFTTAGTYLYGFNFEWATAPTTTEIEVWLNATPTKIGWNSLTGSTKRGFITGVYQFSAADYITFIVNPSGNQTVNSSANYSPEAWAHMIG